LRRVRQELRREVRPPLLLGFSTTILGRGALALVHPFELVIPGGVSEQILKGRGRIVGWRRVVPNHALVIRPLESRLQPETCDTVPVHGNEVQPRRGHLHGQLLKGAAVASREQ